MKKLSIIFFGALLTAFVSCNVNTCNPYFDFDRIDHYFLDIDEDEVMDMFDKYGEEEKIRTKEETRLLDILTEHNKPKQLADTAILHNMKNLGFEKSDITEEKFEQMNIIFCERTMNLDDIVVSTCIAIYRDILVFRKQGEIVGIAKICFDCGDGIIVGTTLNTIAFGQFGEFGQLSKILHKE